MNLPTQALLALCIVPLCAPSGASMQEDKWGKPMESSSLRFHRSFHCRARWSELGR